MYHIYVHCTYNSIFINRYVYSSTLQVFLFVNKRKYRGGSLHDCINENVLPIYNILTFIVIQKPVYYMYV